MIKRGYKALLTFAAVITSCAATAWSADSITGVVHNRTRGQLAVGDEVILLRLNAGGLNPAGLNQSTPEEARTNTDSRGSFMLRVRYPSAAHLVRVVHQGVNYDRQVSAGDGISIDVFDADSRVQGIVGTIEIVRIGSTGSSLHVSDMIEITNGSSPPLTQSGDRAFEVYLPANAKIDSVLAAYSPAGRGVGSGKTAAFISTAPVPGESGHYTVNFPLRPGATKFAFNYDLPYDGNAAFHPRSMYPLQQFAVMIPPTMRFRSRSPAFTVLRTGNDRYQVEAANLVRAGAGPQFEISGVGTLPGMLAQVQSPSKSPVAAQAVPALSAQPSARGAAPRAEDSNTITSSAILARSSHRQSDVQSQAQWWVLGACSLIMGGGGFVAWRRQRHSDKERTHTLQNIKYRWKVTATAEVFQVELLQLEIDRSRGAITGQEYVNAKQALEEIVGRALARDKTG
jgi:hypothetical protein